MEEIARHNRRVHTWSLSMTKLGDGLLNPKLVLAWLLTSVGAGAGFVGFLVPIREAGALLPQLFTAARLRRIAVRKWWWVLGSVVQGTAVLGIALSALFFSGTIAGVLMLTSLTFFALARSICSVSYKDVLGKTVEKPKRGLVTGTASSLASAGVLLFGLLLLFEVFNREQIVFGALFIAATLWLAAARNFSKLEETPSETLVQDTSAAFRQYKQYLFTDTELQKFLIVRALLTATAIAPPFFLLLANSVASQELLSMLGALVVASSFATFVSGRLWGQLSDISTRVVLGSSGLLAAGFLGLSLIAVDAGWYTTAWFLPLLIFVFMVVYEGVRTARTIHLVNLASEETRAAYTAISNTIIGIVLLATGLFGVLAEIMGVQLVLAIFTIMSFFGGVLALRLKRV